MYGLATQHEEGLFRSYTVVVSQALLRMSPRGKARAAPRSRAAEGAPRLTQGMEQAMDVQMADVLCDQQAPNERVAYQAALLVVPTTPPAMSIATVDVETGQPMQIGMAKPRAGESEPQGSAEAPEPTAAASWSEERLLELATSLPSMRTIRHQPRSLRQRKCTSLKKLLQHHTHCHHQWIKRRDSEFVHAEVVAARWAWLGATLLVEACESGEHADDEGLTLGQRRKLSIELAGKRATLAETGAWIELSRKHVRDLL